MEALVVDIIHNMNLLISTLRNKLDIFEEDGGFNVEDRLKERSRDQEIKKKKITK